MQRRKEHRNGGRREKKEEQDRKLLRKNTGEIKKYNGNKRERGELKTTGKNPVSTISESSFH